MVDKAIENQTQIPWIAINAIILGIVIYVIGLFLTLLTPVPCDYSLYDYPEKMEDYMNMVRVFNLLKDLGFMISLMGCAYAFYRYRISRSDYSTQNSERMIDSQIKDRIFIIFQILMTIAIILAIIVGLLLTRI